MTTQLTRQFVLAAPVAMLALLAGCDGDSTRASYQAPIPLGITLSKSLDGDWIVAAGIATPVGTFGIEHTFVAEGGYSYLVLRDRKKGTDQVLKMAADGYLTAHAVGDHWIRMSREGKKWVIDINTVEGTIDIKVYPNSTEIAHIVFSKDEPTVSISTDQKLTIKQPGWFASKQEVCLDSLSSVEWEKSCFDAPNMLRFKWKDKVAQDPIAIPIVATAKVDGDFSMLKGAIEQINPTLKCIRISSYRPGPRTVICLLLALISGGTLVGALYSGNDRHTRKACAWWTAGLFVACNVCFVCQVPSKGLAMIAVVIAVAIPLAICLGIGLGKWVVEQL